jgi:glycosyltransferase involved in cell wall biosynthesis
MRILMVTQFYSPTIGGQERVVEDLSRELTARGHHVAVATLQHGDLPPVSDVSGVRVYRIRSTSARFFPGYVDPTRPHAPPAVDPRAAAELRRVTRLEQPDIVHGHDWLIHSFLPLKRRNGPGLVVTLHDQSLVCANKRLIRKGEACTGPGPAKCLSCSASHYGLAKGSAITVGNWVMSALERELVDMFLPVSQVVADAARLTGRDDRHRVIPNFLPTNGSSTAEGATLPGLPSKFILFVGDVARDKGVGVLLEAHSRLEDPPPLILIGRIVEPEILTAAFGPERMSSAALLAAPIGSVRAVGPQPHDVVLDAFRRCTATVVPSLMREAFGLVALEAMSAGRPVIASNIGGLPDIIRDDKDGILVEPGDVEGLRAALVRVITDAALRSRLRAAAKRRAAKFAADLIVPAVEDAYEDVLAKRQRTGQIGSGSPRRGSSVVLALSKLGRAAAPRLASTGRRIWNGLQPREPRVLLGLTALGLAATAIPAGAWTPLRAILLLPFALFLPGYALILAIFRRRGPGATERIVLALGVSLVIAALASLFLDLVSLRLTLRSWAAALAVVTVGATLFGAAHTEAASDRSTPPRRRHAFRPQLRLVPTAITLAAAGLVAAAVVLARTPLPSSSAPGYTALWLTRKPHSAALTVGIRSEEHRRTRYRLRLVLEGRTTSRELALDPGETWQKTLPPVRLAAASLYRAGDPGVYRSVRYVEPRRPAR